MKEVFLELYLIYADSLRFWFCAAFYTAGPAATLEMFSSWPMKFHQTPEVVSAPYSVYHIFDLLFCFSCGDFPSYEQNKFELLNFNKDHYTSTTHLFFFPLFLCVFFKPIFENNFFLMILEIPLEKIKSFENFEYPFEIIFGGFLI